MKKIRLLVFVFFFFMLNASTIFSQTNSEYKKYYNWFDAVVGVGNTDLYNGIQYKRIYNTLNNNHEYYLNSQFVKGNLEYNNQPFYDVSLKYDIFNDEVIVWLPSYYSYNIIKLIKSKIKSFSINKHYFVNLSINKDDSLKGISGFYEVIFEDSNLKIYKKHKKSIEKRLDKAYVYDVFKEKEEYFIYSNNNFYQIKSKGSIIKSFPKFKKNINLFYNKNKGLKKVNYNKFLFELSTLLSSKINNN